MAFTEPEKNVRQMHLSEGDVVVDLGAGMGAYVFAAAKIVGDNGKVYAVEVQKEFLSKIKKEAENEKLDNVEVIWGDIEMEGGTQLEDNSADAVILSNVFFQVEDKKGLLKEAMRILKPKGKVLFVEWADSFRGLGPKPEAIIPKEELKKLCSEAGLEFRQDIEAGDHHYGFMARNA